MDIPNQLRLLADAIEAGEEIKPEAAYVVLVDPDAFRPIFYQWGEVADRHGIAGLFTHCAQLALTDRDDD